MTGLPETKPRYDFSNWRVAEPVHDLVVAPRYTELPKGIEVSGFTPERETFIRGLVARVGLPLDGVTSISYRPNDSNNEDTLGQAAIETGELYFFKKMEGIPVHAQETSQVAVVAHELGHNLTASHKRNEVKYGGKEEMASAWNNVKTVAKQTADTHSFLTGYHKWIYQEMAAGRKSEYVYLVETEAIMIQLRLSNPKKLEQVLNAQNPFSAKEIMGRFNKTMVTLMGFQDVNELNNHVEALREYYRPKNHRS